jgi:Tol biopolymer transport system component/DNA-binding winged helix-turn-helix (wHTH) protein
MLSAVATRYVWDDFVLNLDTYRLERAGAPLSLEPKAFNLLALMVRRPGHLFSKQELFEAVWPDTAVTDHALTRVVAQLRKVLGDEAREGRFLETVPTRGYRWIRPVQELPDHVDAGSPGVTIPPPAQVAMAPPRWRSKSAAAALALTAAVTLLLFWPQRPVPASAGDAAHPVRWPVQLTTHSGLDLHPAVSPTGDAIAFASDRSGVFEIYVRALGATTAEVPLTGDGGHNVQPAWSPDGRFIAYHSYRHGGVWVIPSRGGTARQLAATGSKPAWSPDSRRIAFQSDEHADVAPTGFGAQTGSTLWVVNLDGGDLRALTDAGRPLGGHAAPSWSPDGRRLAFTVFDGGRQGGAWMLDLETRAVTLVEQGKLYESVFAPDGSALYLAGGEPLIVRIPLDPSTAAPRGVREVIPVAGVPGVRGLTISSDGQRLAFAGLASNSHIWAQPITPDGSPASAPVRLTTDTSRRNSLPVVSPDGSRVAYMSSRRGGLPNVWVMGIDGSLPTQLTSEETSEYQPVWSPDGRRVAYLSNRGESQGLWAVDIATRREERIIDVGAVRARREAAALRGTLAELQLSPSLTRVAFSLLTPPEGRRVIYLAGIEPFEPRALTDPRLSIGYPAWSPDERSLAVEIKDGSSTHAGIVDVDTGRLRQLTRERGQTWVRSWSPDGGKIAVAALRGGAWNLRWIDVRTGREGPVTEPGPARAYVRYPVWSPRGDVVVFEGAEMLGNIWTLLLAN